MGSSWREGDLLEDFEMNFSSFLYFQELVGLVWFVSRNFC